MVDTDAVPRTLFPVHHNLHKTVQVVDKTTMYLWDELQVHTYKGCPEAGQKKDVSIMEQWEGLLSLNSQ